MACETRGTVAISISIYFILPLNVTTCTAYRYAVVSLARLTQGKERVKVSSVSTQGREPGNELMIQVLLHVPYVSLCR